nr:unnamed protein product [Digitaria exilis]
MLHLAEAVVAMVQAQQMEAAVGIPRCNEDTAVESGPGVRRRTPPRRAASVSDPTEDAAVDSGPAVDNPASYADVWDPL